ncbi:MAG: VWA domain-containing protein [Deltaproteobacteria bacterium]|nr:MAG: VWA domain-containing protein [Deltaproteobacteria bacterium]
MRLASNHCNQVDVCLVVDTTGSMGPFIKTARKELVSMVKTLRSMSKLDVQVGLVEYRDHPPIETTFLTRIHPLSSDLEALQVTLEGLRARGGGGDGPEAVFQGLYEACRSVEWREHSMRFAFLIGDAPPHAFPLWLRARTGQHFPNGRDCWPMRCPSGLSVDSAVLHCERKRIRLFSLSLGRNPQTGLAFQALAWGTGGEHFAAENPQGAMEQMQSILEQEFAHMHFDRQVLEATKDLGKLQLEALSESLDCSRVKVATSVARLGARGFFAASL